MSGYSRLPLRPRKRKTAALLRHMGVLLIALLLAWYTSGCRNLGLSPDAMMDDYFKQVIKSISAQGDAELVKQGVPTIILLLDASVAQSPNDSKRLLTAAIAYTTYAQAFLGSEEDMQRAALLYGRARSYGLRILDRCPAFARARRQGSMDDFTTALRCFDEQDVPALYTTGSAWLGWILSQPDSMEALDQLPQVMALLKRVMELDHSYADGGVHLMFGIYYAVLPQGGGRNLQKSLQQFRYAMALAGQDNLLPQVTYAEFYLTAAGKEKQFVELLTKIAHTPIDNSGYNRHALINAIARRRAARLLENLDDYFDTE